ncbi:MAG: MFS domain-containing histidine kinase [Pelagimonas sp.]|uniref:MFS domain-containing histidine kinase n=1 Tax=Pelagimonas sp. TaxID=2073170 RepID=UPI003D6B550B
MTLEPGHTATDMVPELRYWASLDPEVSTAITAFRDGHFRREWQTVSYSTRHSPETWTAVEIINQSPDDGRAGDRFVVTMDAPLVSGVRIFLVRQGGLTENLTDYSIFAPFDPVDHIVTRLRTPDFVLKPGEQVTLLAHVQTGPFPSFGMDIHSPEHLAQASFRWGVLLTGFYAFALSCLVFFFGFQAAMRSAVGVWNAVLFAVFLAVLAFVDGLLFRTLYPQHPQYASAIGFGLLFAMSGAGFLVAGAGIARLAPQLARRVSGLALLSLAGFCLAIWVPGPIVAVSSYLLIGLMLVANVVSARGFAQDTVAPPVGAIWVSGLAVLGAMIVIGLMLSGLGGRWLDAPSAMRVVFAALLLATMTFLSANVVALRRRHLSAVEARVVALEAEAQRANELLESERNYAQARDLAAQRQRQLATASHDLRQPLMSLRMTFDSLAKEMQPEVKTRLNDAFDYLGALATGYVDDSVPESEMETEPEQQESEPYPLSVPLGTVLQMFEGEAQAKGVSLRVVTCDALTTAPPLALMRIVTNLVSNAIKYTETGGVLVGVRHGKRLRICVLDTGPGMSAEDIAQFRQAYSKGGSSQGHGLGLAVCFDLARENNMDLEVTSVRGKGSCFSLTL